LIENDVLIEFNLDSLRRGWKKTKEKGIMIKNKEER